MLHAILLATANRPRQAKRGDRDDLRPPMLLLSSRLVALLEPTGREVRRRAVRASEMSERERAPKTGVDLSHGPVWEDANALLQGGSVNGRDLRHVND